MANLATTLKKAREARATAFQRVQDFAAAVEARTFDVEKDTPALDAAQRTLEAAELEVERVQNLINIQSRSVSWADGPGETEEDDGNEKVIRSHFIPKRKKDSEAVQNFSLTKFIRSAIHRRPQDGLEFEMHQEGEKEMREARLDAMSGFCIPGFIARGDGLQKRDLLVGTTTMGGHTVATDMGKLIPFLDPKMSIRELGAMYLTNLQGNLDLPRRTARATAAWGTEVATLTESNPTFDKVSMAPKRLGTWIDASMQMLAQSTVAVENMMRSDLNEAVSRELELVALMGSGASSQPSGIIVGRTGTPSIATSANAVTTGANGAVPTWSTMVEFETAVANSDAIGSKMGYLTTPGIAGVLKNTKRDVAGNGFIWEGRNDGEGQVNGYKAMATNLMGKVFVRGTSGAVCHGIIFGNWNELIIGQWGGLNLVVDEYSQATSGIVRVVVNSFFDIGLRHGASFGVCVDAKIS